MLRPDEKANQAEIERDKLFRSNAGKVAVTAGSFGAAAIGGPLAARIMPFLNQYIPASLAVQGISKVSPQVGSFLKRGESMGLNIQDGLQFLKDQISPKEPTQKEQPKENRNIIQQYSPELHQFMEQRIQKGENPYRAAAAALFDKNADFKSIIRKLEKDHKTNWSDLVQSIYGSLYQPNQESQQQQTFSQAANAPMNQNQSAASGQGSQALMNILQKINQSLGGSL